MTDSIDTLPARVVAVDTADHEIEIHPSLSDEVGETGYIEVTTGSFAFSVGRLVSSGSAVYASASNNKFIVTMKSGRIHYKATTAGDIFVLSL